MNRNIPMIITCLLLAVVKLYSQDITFSQFYENPLLRNPALAGIFEGDVRVEGTFRNQWESVTVPYSTQALSTEVKFPVGNNADWMTAGLQLTHDVAGDIKLGRTQFLPVVNYHKSLSGDNDNYLSLAFMGGFVSSQFDPTLLMLGDQYNSSTGSYDPNIVSAERFNRSSFTYWDASTGLSWSSSFDVGNDNTARYYVGAGLFHFNKPKVGFYTNDTTTSLSEKFVVNGGLTLPVSDVNTLVFYADYLRQGGNRQFLGGVLYGMDVFHDYFPSNDELYKDLTIYAGLFYRWNDALIPTLKLDIFDFSVGASYDVTLSQLSTASQLQGGFELNLSYKAKLNNRRNGQYTDPNSSSGSNERGSRNRIDCKMPRFGKVD